MPRRERNPTSMLLRCHRRQEHLTIVPIVPAAIIIVVRSSLSSLSSATSLSTAAIGWAHS